MIALRRSDLLVSFVALLLPAPFAGMPPAARLQGAEFELTFQTRDDKNMIKVSNGSNLARYPSVVFKVFIDGKEAAASSVMRVQSPAWRFDVPLPNRSRMISLAVTDAGDGSREDFADWADAGLLVRK